MTKLISRYLVGVLAVLSSSVSMASTITMVPSSTSVGNNNTFSVVLHADAFDKTAGASLGLTFNSSLVTLTSIQLCTVALCPTVSPFDSTTQLISGGFTVAFGAAGSVCDASYPTAPFNTSPCNFDAVRFNFTAAATGSGNANIVLVDDSITKCWGDVDTFDCIGNPPSTIAKPNYVQANVTIGGGAPAPNIVVTDSVVPPDDHDIPFGSITQGQTNTQTVTVTNTGNATLNVGTITAPAAPFTLVNDMCSGQPLAAGTPCTVGVHFAPTATGLVNSSFVINSNDPDTPAVTVTVSGTGTPPPAPNIAVTPVTGSVAFGSVNTGTVTTQTVTVTNSGNADLHLTSLASANPLAAPFSIPVATDACSGQTLTPSSSCQVVVRFAPTVTGAVSDAFDIPSDDPDEPSVTVNVSGTGTPPPAPNIIVTDSVAPNNDQQIPFGNVTVGGLLTAQTVTVTNNGNANLVIGTIPGTNPLAAPFTIANDTCSGQSLTSAPAAGSSCTFDVKFQPTAIGPFNDAFTIPTNDPDTPQASVSVSGTGTGTMVPDITVTDSVAPADDLLVAFGGIDVYAFGHQTITVTNDGASDLRINDVGLANPLNAEFSIVADSCSGQQLAPTETCSIGVDFRPTSIQAFNDAFDIPSNDPDEASVTVGVSGNGKPRPETGNTSALDPATLLGLGLFGMALRRRRRS